MWPQARLSFSRRMEFRRDLNEIGDYIAPELQSIPAAERVVTDILDAVRQLEDFAEPGVLLSSIADVEGGFRFLVTGSYLTFYQIENGEFIIQKDGYFQISYNLNLPAKSAGASLFMLRLG